MIGNQVALLKREFWEHRSIWAAPAAMVLVSVLLATTSLVVGSGFKEVVNLAIVGASNIDAGERRHYLVAVLAGFTIVIALSMWVLTVFYCLDALYAERKDKSILFWRSLPITDTETVVSKLLTAFFVVPAVSYVAVLLAQILSLIILSVWISAMGGSPGHLLWNLGALFDSFAFAFLFMFSIPLWLAPFVGWFLFVSAFTKRSPLLFGFLPILVVPTLEYMVVGTKLLSDAIFVRTVKLPLFGGERLSELIEDGRIAVAAEMTGILSLIDVVGFLTHPSLWLGLIVCGLFSAAAVFVRRYRDES